MHVLLAGDVCQGTSTPAKDALGSFKKECNTAERQRQEFLAAFDKNTALRCMLQAKQSWSLLVGQHAPEMQLAGQIWQVFVSGACWPTSEDQDCLACSM